MSFQFALLLQEDIYLPNSSKLKTNAFSPVAESLGWFSCHNSQQLYFRHLKQNNVHFKNLTVAVYQKWNLTNLHLNCGKNTQKAETQILAKEAFSGWTRNNRLASKDFFTFQIVVNATQKKVDANFWHWGMLVFFENSHRFVKSTRANPLSSAPLNPDSS